MRPIVLMPLALVAMSAALCVTGCDRVAPVDRSGNAAAATQANSTPMTAGVRPVRIGEGGAGFPACGARGVVTGLAPGATLPVRAAPLGDADVVGQIDASQRLYVCTRSINQRWLGIVAPPPADPAEAAGNTAAPAADCGLSRRVPDATEYDGPCLSGWVSSAQIRLIAG